MYGLAWGYENLNDHDRLRCDPMLALAVGKGDITGNDKVRERARGNALAGKSSLNRLELSSEKSDRYRRTPVVIDAVRKFLVESFIRITGLEGVPKRLFLDVDSTDDPLHGDQDVEVLPRLLRQLLLPSPVHLPQRSSVVREASPVEHRCFPGNRGRA